MRNILRPFAVVCAVVALVQSAGPALAQGAKDKVPIALSPDQRLVATAVERTISISDNQTQKLLMRMPGHTDKVTALAFAPDGRLLASSSLDKSISLWELATGKQVRRLRAPAGVLSVSFSPDGRRLISRDADQTTRTWDVATGQQIKAEKK